MDDELWSALIGLGLIIGAIYVIVVYVIPLLLGLVAVILAIFGFIGLFVGLFFEVKNFVVSIEQVKRKRNYLGKFKDKTIQDRLNSESVNGDYSAFVYEECASKSYFFDHVSRIYGTLLKEHLQKIFLHFQIFLVEKSGIVRLLFLFGLYVS